MTDTKKTVVVGASPNPSRYAYSAVSSLKSKGHPVIPVGFRKGEIEGIPIETEKIAVENVDTVTLYVGPQHQDHWREYILSLNPRRVVFNPGTENPEFEAELEKKGIQTTQSCTLVMLSVGNY